MIPNVRSLDEIAADGADPRPLPLEPASFRGLEAIFGGRAFGADYVWLSPESAVRHHRSLDERFGPELSEHWRAFGTTGQGDMWLVRRSAPGDVAFLDHDDEGRFRPREMKLSLADWVRLADFFGRFETLARANRDMLDERHRLRPQHRRDVVAALESIAAGLSKRIPFSL